MIQFKPKKFKEKDLIDEVIDYLEKVGCPFTQIKEKEADEISKINSKSMVLRELKLEKDGKFYIAVQDKDCYRYTSKLLGNCGMKGITQDPKTRITRAYIDYLGKALSTVEVLSLHYNLSIVN